MKSNQYKIKSEVWLYPGDVGWHFITIPRDISKEIKTEYRDLTRGWGSLPVEVTIGKTTWRTSIFPDTKIGAYLLPVKAAVRKSEDLTDGSKVDLLLEIKA